MQNKSRKENRRTKMLTLTANMGIGVMRSALRLQKNFSEFEEIKELNKTETGCYSCTECLQNPSACINCCSKKYRTVLKKKYYNEKNRYGQRPVLRKFGLLLFIYLHFLNPDKCGLVNIDLEDAANYLHCDIKTIRNNLHLLETYKYIILGGAICPGYYKLFICDYKNYFKSAKENGRGYTYISLDLFNCLIEMQSINEIRITMRSFLYSVDCDRKGTSSERTYQDIKRDLPEYCTKKDIKETIKNPLFNKYFNVKESKYTIKMSILDTINPFTLTKKLREECRSKVKNFVDSINRKASGAKDYFILLSNELNDISYIGLKYPAELITDAISQIYESFVLKGIDIDNLGALIRSTVKSNTEFISGYCKVFL